jgi:predicted cobalt transporter CbtA
MDFSMFAVLAIGIFILVTGILIYRGPGETLQSAIRESLIWGTGFFISFGAEMLMISNS